jgi:hypothetical protein
MKAQTLRDLRGPKTTRGRPAQELGLAHELNQWGQSATETFAAG